MYRLTSLIAAIKNQALFRGKVTLASGQTSDYYIDLSKILYDTYTLSLVSTAIVDLVDRAEHHNRWHEIDAIGGPATGALPIITALMMEKGYDTFFPRRGFFTRKESKEYGKKDLIEGNLHKSDRVLLVEDVTTTGTSLLRTAQAVKNYGCSIQDVISVVDRNQGAKALFNSHGLPFKALINIEEILE